MLCASAAIIISCRRINAVFWALYYKIIHRMQLLRLPLLRLQTMVRIFVWCRLSHGACAYFIINSWKRSSKANSTTEKLFCDEVNIRTMVLGKCGAVVHVSRWNWIFTFYLLLLLCPSPSRTLLLSHVLEMALGRAITFLLNSWDLSSISLFFFFTFYRILQWATIQRKLYTQSVKRDTNSSEQINRMKYRTFKYDKTDGYMI